MHVVNNLQFQRGAHMADSPHPSLSLYGGPQTIIKTINFVFSKLGTKWVWIFLLPGNNLICDFLYVSQFIAIVW